MVTHVIDKYRVDGNPCYLYYSSDVFMILHNLVFNKNLRTGIAVGDFRIDSFE